MITFNATWYEKFVQSTNEKGVLVKRINDILAGKPKKNCLEIGLGTSPYFAENLSSQFDEYIIVERELLKQRLPAGVILINDDWENVALNKKFDVIIASHVVYYFKDKEVAINKMFNLLSGEGRIIFVVNGKGSDYGPLKLAFSKMIGSTYTFTYDELLALLSGKKLKEYTLPTEINFSSFDELFDVLRLSFDNYPEEYKHLKPKIIDYFEKNIKGGKFIIDQKIIEVENE